MPERRPWLTPVDDDLPLSRVIADRLAGAIVHGELAPGAKLAEEELAKTFQTSRTPVREALRLLEREALVTFTPRKGVRVSRITREDARELYLLRGHLGGLAARLAAEQATPTEVESLRRLQASLGAALAASDKEQYMQFAIEFDDVLVEIARNKLLEELLHRLRRRALRVNIALTLPVDLFRASMELRRSLLEAVAEARVDDAQRLMQDLNALTWDALSKERLPFEVGPARRDEGVEADVTHGEGQ